MRTLYIVQRVNWTYSDEWYYEDGAQPVRAFASPADAETHRAKMEEDARREISESVPEDEYEWWSQNLTATFGGLENVTSLTEAALTDRLAEMGVPSYPFDEIDHWLDNAHWRTIWEAINTPTRREVVWKIFDKVRFYEVVDVEAEL